MINVEAWKKLTSDFSQKNITLVAVSKKKPVEDIQSFYDLGQRDFGENYVQELVEKAEVLPKDIRWHFIGHLQSNKAKNIAPFVHLIHGIDSFELLAEVNKQAKKCGRVIDVLLQLYIAKEDSKFGMSETEVQELLDEYRMKLPGTQNVRICGLMGMATNTDDTIVIQREYEGMRRFFDALSNDFFRGKDYFSICSMGMSADYDIAVVVGSTLVRVGSLLFGERQY